MKKFVALGLMLSGMASAVNLSQLKVSDVCYLSSTAVPIRDEDKPLGVFDSFDMSAANSKLRAMGFDSALSRDFKCAYYLIALPHYRYNTNGTPVARVRFDLTLLKDPTNKYQVSNSYYSFYEVKNPTKADVERVFREEMMAVVDQFIADWKQAHR